MRKVVVLKWAAPGDKRFRIAQASELGAFQGALDEVQNHSVVEDPQDIAAVQSLFHKVGLTGFECATTCCLEGRAMMLRRMAPSASRRCSRKLCSRHHRTPQMLHGRYYDSVRQARSRCPCYFADSSLMASRVRVQLTRAAAPEPG